MVFDFGLAIQTVVIALLPGGSLNPPQKALNPLLCCMGSLMGPVSVYFSVLAIFRSQDILADPSARFSQHSDPSRLNWSSSELEASGDGAGSRMIAERIEHLRAGAAALTS